MLRSLGVFCGSSRGRDGRHAAAARALGSALARRGVTLVYGGGRVGLMGELANAALEAGGRVIGVIPRSLTTKEVAHAGLHEQHVVDTLFERKARMVAMSDAFVALAGGLGTLDELFEVVTLQQLGFHEKPCGLLDVAGFYADLRAHLERAVQEEFTSARHRDLLIVREEPEALIDALAALAARTK